MSQALNAAIQTLTNRASRLNAGLAQGGPVDALPGLIDPVIKAAQLVLQLAQDASTFERVPGIFTSAPVVDSIADPHGRPLLPDHDRFIVMLDIDELEDLERAGTISPDDLGKLNALRAQQEKEGPWQF